MSSTLKYFALLLTILLILSCMQNPKAKEIKTAKKAEFTLDSLIDIPTDDLVSFISGMDHGRSGCLSKLDSTVKWDQYARELDSTFSRIGSVRFEKMKSWADSEFVKNPNITTVFYPFSGPDFLNANIFYPNADQYIMLALEPIGNLPDICNTPPDSVTSYLNKINNSLRDVYKRSYFITSTMNDDLRKTKVNGVISLLSFFIKRTGHHIVSIKSIGIDSEGNWQLADSLKNQKNVVPGIKIDFLSLSGKKVQTVFYFKTDISDKGLEKNQNLRKYLSRLPQSDSYLKAGSYLLHYETFKEIRSVIFDKSSTILQDDSGIAYKYFDKKMWKITLYGNYARPIDEFKFISEPDLEKAYKDSIVEPLPFILGYNWRTGHINMLYAVKNAK